MTEQSAILDMTSDIVSAYVSNNTVRASEIADLISTVHISLTGLGTAKPAEEPAPDLKPAVPIKKSVTNDFIISLEDGRKFKSMKRYLSLLGMTPDGYRRKWGLTADYPMVAPGYAAKRSELAKAAGLGASRRTASADVGRSEAAKPTGIGADGDDAWEAAAPEKVAQESEVHVRQGGPVDAVQGSAERRGRPKKAA